MSALIAMTHARQRGSDGSEPPRAAGRRASIVAVIEAGWLLFLFWMAVRGG